MVLKLNIDRLLKAELEYELCIRGLDTTGIVQVLRTRLRDTLREEGREGAIARPAHPYSFDEDYNAVLNTITVVAQKTDEYITEPDRDRAAAIEARFYYAFTRITNSKSTNEDEEAKRAELFGKLAVARSTFEVAQLTVTSFSDVPEAHSVPSASTSSTTPSQVTTTSTTSVPISSISTPPVRTISVKSVPVAQWNLQFSGDSRGLSVNAFIERVEELRLARNLSEDELFAQAIDLFSSNALLWYRANKVRPVNWKQLIVLLRQQFQPADYDERLLEEIKRRTQGPSESMGIYIAIVQNMFARLAEPLTEIKQLRIILRNIAPMYQTQLGLVDIPSINELLQYGRKIEERCYAIETYVPPSRRRTDLETDLAYVEAAPVVETPVVNTIQTPVAITQASVAPSVSRTNKKPTSGSGPKCWNCQEEGHRAVACKHPRTKKFCYRCGKPDVIVKNCPKCSRGNRSSGNGPARR